MSTTRQKMIEVLQQAPMDRRDLSQALRISEKEVLLHLPHASKSAKAKGLVWEMTPAYCENCDYTFKDRRRMSAPSKCPRCRMSRIQGPWFQVVKRLNAITQIEDHPTC